MLRMAILPFLYKNGEIAESKTEQMKRALVTLSIDYFPKSKGHFKSTWTLDLKVKGPLICGNKQ